MPVFRGVACRLCELLLLTVATIVAASATANAHTTGETYVWLNVEQERITGRVEINLRDLREKLNIEIEETGDGRMAVLEATREQVLEYISQHYRLEANGELIPLEFTTLGILDLPDDEGRYAQYFYQSAADTAVPDKVTVTNSMFVDDDFIHRSLVCVERNDKSGQTFEGEFAAMVFGSHNRTQELDLTNIELLLRPRDFIWQGVLHIWIGYDHILFIITLLLPAVLMYQDLSWRPVGDFKTAFWNIIRIVTIFTVAHSITLSLAALGLVKLPSWIVESVIALSIVLVAINTISPRFRDKTWIVIFGFGLFHGMGFASVMSELPFRMLNLVKVLIGFNVGVELGQLAIVAVVFPLIYLIRRHWTYVPVVLRGGSAVIAAVACFWFVERAFAF
ncbi:MAG: HupE/UreJ family protein [Planctomycetaceae bacterium]|nr:HupE/UreJ family protein [Planctomycetaceae bacterium]